MAGGLAVYNANIDTLSKRWLQPGQKYFQRLLQRFPSLRVASLVIVHTSGCILMLSPPLTLVLSAGSALQLQNNIQGPLDWFLLEVLGAIALLSAYLSFQLFRLSPAQPRGITVDESSAPALHVMLARRVNHFKMRPIKQILVTPEVELRIVATPILPLPLFHKYTLCAGMPMMLLLNQGQFRLALAGAVAAAANSRSCLVGSLNQACADWPLILAALTARDNLLSRLMSRPLKFIATASDTLGQTMITDWRQQQGQWMLDNCDEKNAVDLIANQIVAAAFMEKRYWPMVLKAAERCPTPVVKAFSHLPLLLDKTLNQQLAERWLVQSQAVSEQQTGVRDLLADLRIEHLSWSGLPKPNAFDDLLESNNILKQLDRFWQRNIEPEWRRRHVLFQNDQIRFKQLHKRDAEFGLHGESALRYIKLAPDFLDLDDTISAYHNVYSNNRDDAKVCYAAGLALLRAGANEEGSSALLRAAELEPSLARRARTLITEHRQAWVNDGQSNHRSIMQGVCA
jgi:hypothetical protein